MKHIALLFSLAACGSTTEPGANRPPSSPVAEARPAEPPTEQPERDPVDREAGKFIEFDLISDRPEEAAAFYTALFSWTVGRQGGDVWTLSSHGRVVARVRRHQVGGPVPIGWLCWISVDDVDDLSRDIPGNGGHIRSAARDSERGREAIVEGPTGGVLGVIDPKAPPDPDRRLRAGDFVLSQLWTRDYDRALSFYALIGGYTSKEIRFASTRYRVLENDGAPRAIIRRVPTGRKVRWTPFVIVDDVGATVAAARRLGARVITAPRELETIGRVAVFEAPTGGVLGIIEPVDPDVDYAPRKPRNPVD